MKNILTYKIHLKITEIGNNIHDNIERKLQNNLEGKCTVEGYIKPASIKLLTYSSGLIESYYIIFETVFECLVCRPVEGMKIYNCIVKNNTKAGIRAEIKDNFSPVVIFVSRDHHYQSKYFSNVKEDDIITVRVIGIRYELNDKYISIIAKLMEPKKRPKIKLVLEK